MWESAVEAEQQGRLSSAEGRKRSLDAELWVSGGHVAYAALLLGMMVATSTRTEAMMALGHAIELFSGKAQHPLCDRIFRVAGAGPLCAVLPCAVVLTLLEKRPPAGGTPGAVCGRLPKAVTRPVDALLLTPFFVLFFDAVVLIMVVLLHESAANKGRTSPVLPFLPTTKEGRCMHLMEPANARSLKRLSQLDDLQAAPTSWLFRSSLCAF